MLLLRTQAATSLWLLFLVQAHRTLSCTFTKVQLEAFPWNKVQYNETIKGESEGDCLKKCLEDYPDCLAVCVEPYYGQIYCFLYVPRSVPMQQTVKNANPNQAFYLLERDKDDPKCPLVNTVLPA
uniref:Apple domain-containing protein n=1 Tax=Haemonchus contortus TaxID=6289 RepID=A0A7I4YZW1_HAECO